MRADCMLCGCSGIGGKETRESPRNRPRKTLRVRRRRSISTQRKTVQSAVPGKMFLSWEGLRCLEEDLNKPRLRSLDLQFTISGAKELGACGCGRLYCSGDAATTKVLHCTRQHLLSAGQVCDLKPLTVAQPIFQNVQSECRHLVVVACHNRCAKHHAVQCRQRYLGMFSESELSQYWAKDALGILRILRSAGRLRSRCQKGRTAVDWSPLLANHEAHPPARIANPRGQQLPPTVLTVRSDALPESNLPSSRSQTRNLNWTRIGWHAGLCLFPQVRLARLQSAGATPTTGARTAAWLGLHRPKPRVAFVASGEPDSLRACLLKEGWVNGCQDDVTGLQHQRISCSSQASTS